MRKALLIGVAVGLCILSGCGDVGMFTVSSGETTEQGKTSEVYVEDTNTYGNTIGNIYYEGLLLQSERDEIYIYNDYDGCLNKINTSKRKAEIIPVEALKSLSAFEGIIYGIHNDSLSGERIVSYNPKDNTSEIVREGSVLYLQAVNGNLYFTDEYKNYLRQYNLQTKEEIVLVEEPVYYPVVYKDRIYFQLDSDRESLYSIPAGGGEMNKLNDIRSHYPVIYKDKIYYCDEEDAMTIRRMNLDGSEDSVWLKDVYPEVLNIYGVTLFFVDLKNPSELSFVELDSDEIKVQTLDMTESIRTALEEYLGNDSKSLLVLQRLGSINVTDDYILFWCNELIDGKIYTDEYVYDRNTGEIYILEALKDKEKNVSEDACPSGDYTEGSVYGPNLTQRELEQVAGAVRTFLNSYDWEDMDDYTKVVTAHDYLCDNVKCAEGDSHSRADTAWGALVYHEAQSSGYARAMKALCDAMGVECYCVQADDTATDSGYQWNQVCVDGNWYIVDVADDDITGDKEILKNPKMK